MIEGVISRLGMDSSSQSYVLVLQEKDGTRMLPIWIGQAEAHSIVVHMHGVKHERPFTHDLCKSLILQLGGAVRRVQITRVENSLPGLSTESSELSAEQLKEYLEHLRPEDFGKFNL